MACQILSLLLWNISELRIERPRHRYHAGVSRSPGLATCIFSTSSCKLHPTVCLWNKDLLWHSHAYSFLYCLRCFCITMAELSYSSRKRGPQGQKSGPLEKVSRLLLYTSQGFGPMTAGPGRGQESSFI